MNATRRSVIASLGLALAAGCVGRSPRGTPTSSAPPTTRGTPGRFTPGVNVPDPDHPIYLDNQESEPRRVRVRVEQIATGKLVFDETREIAPGAEVEVYNLEQADPEGVEAYAVCGEAVDRPAIGERGPECVTIESSRCYGSVHVTVRGDAVDVIYAIC